MKPASRVHSFVGGRVLFVGIVASLSLVGCRKQQTERGPGDTVFGLLEALKRVHGDPAVGALAVRLLDRTARDNLTERARRASALSGRQVTPGEMLVPSFFSLHLIPTRSEVHAHGESAEVVLFGRDSRQAVVRTVREDGEWKVALELPELSPIRQRESAEGDD